LTGKKPWFLKFSCPNFRLIALFPNNNQHNLLLPPFTPTNRNRDLFCFSVNSSAAPRLSAFFFPRTFVQKKKNLSVPFGGLKNTPFRLSSSVPTVARMDWAFSKRMLRFRVGARKEWLSPCTLVVYPCIRCSIFGPLPERGRKYFFWWFPFQGNLDQSGDFPPVTLSAVCSSRKTVQKGAGSSSPPLLGWEGASPEEIQGPCPPPLFLLLRGPLLSFSA